MLKLINIDAKIRQRTVFHANGDDKLQQLIILLVKVHQR